MVDILKQLLPGLLEAYNLPRMTVERAPYASFASPVIKDHLKSLAPDGFSGREQDNYYIIQMLLSSDMRRFSPKQCKQLLTYLRELDLIFRFFLLSSDPTIDLRFSADAPITINIPYKYYLALETCSSNTFGRLNKCL